MIVDSHCHAWRYWPYEPPVPDPESRGTIEQLLWEMDRNGVDKAVVICARIEHNPDNNDYIAYQARRFPDRLYQFADVDCRWWETYHQPGAADRLRQAVHRYGLRGFTHYFDPQDDGSWYLSDEGLAFLQAAVDLNQIASFAMPARLQPVLRQLAERFPSLHFLCHHMAGARLAEGPDGGQGLREIVKSAALPNIHVKLSGFHYLNPVGWDFPHAACRPVVKALYEHFGPERLHWGSDYPVLRKAMTYQQALEAVRTHCDFIASADLRRILGDSLYDLLERHGSASG
ncbi:MAG: amidohydrolase [Chloroflexi bacterium]|nr:amidohydrolase [Chloroflexota bacterium]